jgi:transposase
MPRVISKDLRHRVVEAHLGGKGTYKQLAELFGIGEASVSRWMRLHREKGELTPAPRGGGFPARIPRSEYPALERLVAEKPDRTVSELRDQWQQRFGRDLSRSAMQRALSAAGFTWKKNAFVRRSSGDPKSKRSARHSSK